MLISILTLAPNPDDIFFIWDNTVQELDHFITYLNSLHATSLLKLPLPIVSPTWDLYISFLSRIKLCKLKPISSLPIPCHFYIHGHSNHPSLIFKGAYRGENIHIPRNTSEDKIYKSIFQSMKSQFKTRKYPSHLINSPEIPFSNRH